ncbi:aldo/keto reductase [Pedobacter sp. MC2016-14]|uniref:aldo/keto reductase n=1 Tax=Pedobacter sp. MC2016-14 TaxID=2897327 RepID=UPI001E47A166|nr:aldo/keto reductase [Pedobacter sp. MC2016-14]MCD0488058.1 aldo/keto reductase [Pedobacter sp. MC2016-14]
MDRRRFISQTSLASLGMAFLPGIVTDVSAISISDTMNNFENAKSHKRFRPKYKSGFGGVAIGNGFHENPNIECLQAVEAAWNAGVRYYDTSPWYGLGTSERRLGLFLKDKPADEYTLSTKVGRILDPKENFDVTQAIWKGKMNFGYKYDYTASGVRRSVEDSLQRLGVSSIDIVYIHDLSPDNGDMKQDWLKYFEIAQKGAMPELTKMREEGLIKAWGFGVNTVEPILKAMEVADPDIFLSACQYSLIHHVDDLNKVFPKAAEKDISIVVGAPLCAGFLSGKDRYLYGGDFPTGVKEKLAALKKVADRHKVDLRTAALQFCAAPDVVSGVIPGAHTVEQATENAASFSTVIPADFWAELKKEKLIAANAPIPKT